MLAYTDLETNGYAGSAVLSVSVRVYEGDTKTTPQLDEPEIDSFFSYVGFDGPINRQAQAVHGIEDDTIREAPDFYEVRNDLRDWLKPFAYGQKITPAGHNYIAFDSSFAERLVGPAWYRSHIDYHVIDTAIYARMLKDAGLLKSDRCVLSPLAEYFGHSNESAHHADADTLMCRQVHCELVKILRPSFWRRVMRVFSPTF